MPQWIRRRDEEFTPESLQAAWEVEPTDALCIARRARNFAMATGPDRYWADLYSKLAMKLAPADAEVAWRRAAVLAVSRKPEEATVLADRAPAPPADSAWGWEAKWEACLLLHHEAAARAARATAEGLAEKMEEHNRISFEIRLREAEAAAATSPSGGLSVGN